MRLLAQAWVGRVLRGLLDLKRALAPLSLWQTRFRLELTHF